MIKNYDDIIKQKRIEHDYKCEVCGRDVRSGIGEELAHRIHKPKGKKKRAKYNIDISIIDHPLNLAYTCHKCNQSVLIDFSNKKKDILIKKIKKVISE